MSGVYSAAIKGPDTHLGRHFPRKIVYLAGAQASRMTLNNYRVVPTPDDVLAA